MSRADESAGRDRTLAPSARRDRWSTIERDLRRSAGPLIAGIDEVGRGPLAGPVVACAVIMPPDERVIRGVDDSKQLTADARARLGREDSRARAHDRRRRRIRSRDRSTQHLPRGRAGDATRARRRLALRPDHVIVDGRAIRTLGTPHTAVIDGDACCYSIACASIIAKVTRDRVMHALAVRYPNYRWERNVGYSTRGALCGHRRARCHAASSTVVPAGAPARVCVRCRPGGRYRAILPTRASCRARVLHRHAAHADRHRGRSSPTCPRISRLPRRSS